VIEAAGFETVLAIAIVDDGPLPFFTRDENGFEEIVAFGSCVLQGAGYGIAVVEGGVICGSGAIDFVVVGESGGGGLCGGEEESDAAVEGGFCGVG